MRTIYEIKEERRKLVKWLGSCDDEMRAAFVQQIKILDWVLEDNMDNCKFCETKQENPTPTE